VDDYLSEKEQWEAIKRWLQENALWIVAGILIAAGVLGGWRWYQGHLDEIGREANAKYAAVMQALGRGDDTQAFVLLGELERGYAPSPYVDQARLAVARAFVENRQLDKAARELQDVAEHSKDPALALVARLRWARVLIAEQKADSALATLDAVKPGAFAGRWHEVRGDALYAKGDKANALKEYLSARSSDPGAAAADDSLSLKITDLSTSPAANAAPATAAVK
jgi:predicted negative regulator of RcsB-dependent stress response